MNNRTNFKIIMASLFIANLSTLSAAVDVPANILQNTQSIAEKESVQILVYEYLKDADYAKPTPLCTTMSGFGSDKGNSWHNYTTIYSKLFDSLKNEPLNVFELGLGTNNIDTPSNMGAEGKPGASLRGWANYFTNGHIYGADIDKRILFQENRIQTFYCDQRDEKCINDLYSNNALKDVTFDIIVEDGLHEFEASKTFLTNSLPKLKKGGIYIVEDLMEDSAANFKKIIPELKTKFSLTYIDIITIPHPTNGYDNRLLIIQK